tara:strand:- start:44 stop:253 length:210 start_codon:yes stop_codon:yes gene_type:complete
MKVGDLVRFRQTGAVALIVEVVDHPDDWSHVVLCVLGDVLDNTACADGVTSVSKAMLKRSAEVISHANR